MRVWNLKFLLYCTVGIAAGLAATVVLQKGSNTILRYQAWQSGMELSGYIETEIPELDQILLGNADHAVAEAELHRLAAIGNVFRFSFYDTMGNEMFTTGSFHADLEKQKVRHHAHEHADTDPMPLPHPEIPTPGLASQATSRHRNNNGAPIASGTDHHAAVPNADGSGDLIHHELLFFDGDGVSTPVKYSMNVHPISAADGTHAGTIVLYQDLSVQAALLKKVLLGAVGSIIALFVLSTLGPLIYYLRLLRERNQANEKIHYLATHDGLTGLINRDSFVALLENSFVDGDCFAVHFLDIDNFKHLNDSFGHEFGDAALKTCATRIRAISEEGLVVARVGGDELAVLQKKAETAKSTDIMSQLMVTAMQEPIQIHGQSVIATASVGSARAFIDGENVNRLMKSADIAMYHAKSEGRNQFCSFQSWMDEKLVARREIEDRLRWALANNGFEINYQPHYCTQTIKLLGFEALLRLRQEDGTPISPAEFIPIAEEIRLIDEIGTWVLYNACRFAAKWPSELKLAVNLSVGQFVSGKLPESVEHALWETKLTSTRLELEITETFFLDDGVDTLTQLNELKELGVSIAMDDFGTGYSSLAYLWQFPFDKVKIDQSFLRGFDKHTQRITRIIETIVGLGHALGMKITAEGVETKEQFEMLKSTNCDQLQGYLLGKPMIEADTLLCIDKDQQGIRVGPAASARQ